MSAITVTCQECARVTAVPAQLIATGAGDGVLTICECGSRSVLLPTAATMARMEAARKGLNESSDLARSIAGRQFRDANRESEVMRNG